MLPGRYDWNLYHLRLRRVFEGIRGLSKDSIHVLKKQILDQDLNVIVERGV